MRFLLWLVSIYCGIVTYGIMRGDILTDPANISYMLISLIVSTVIGVCVFKFINEEEV